MLKHFFIFLVSRIIKIVANGIKLLCYVFHFLFPNKRFTLPKYSPPIYKSEKPSVIPRTLWQTNYTNRVTLPIYINYLFNRMMSPSFEYRFMITGDRAAFIKSNYSPRIFKNYSKLQIGAAQADLWRVLTLQKNGGIYMDIDAHLVWPLGFIVKAEFSELYVQTKKDGVSNYFIASKKDNPHLAQITDIILANIDDGSMTNVYAMTGPGVFNEVLREGTVNTVSYKYACHQGNFTNEYFQYIDKPQGKWTRAQQEIDIVESGEP